MYLRCFMFVFFFFKQKTAYEMRISDWSSDVCSSDLHCYRKASRNCFDQENFMPDSLIRLDRYAGFSTQSLHHPRGGPFRSPAGAPLSQRRNTCSNLQSGTPATPPTSIWRPVPTTASSPTPRSEEHTSDLQSLMRISYAVF